MSIKGRAQDVSIVLLMIIVLSVPCALLGLLIYMCITW